MLHIILQRLHCRRSGETSLLQYQGERRTESQYGLIIIIISLYNQPDFVGVKTILEEHCERRGFLVEILPKYHCELNPLEMVWGRSKFHYRLNPPSKKDEDLHQNVIRSLETVTLTEMRRYVNLYSMFHCKLIYLLRFSRRSVRFMDAYHRGLNGRQAAWANKKYRGHRVLPDSIMKDLDDANID
jgi:hypothetical protein